MKKNPKHEEHLTTEYLSKKFNSQFELVNFMIHMAQNMIKTGRDAQSTIVDNNPALLVIDQLDDNGLKD